MDHHTMHLVRTILGIIGNVISFGLFLSPGPTIWRIVINKSVQEFHPYIYIAGILNCCLWIFYGSPSVHPDSTLIWTINSVGLLLYTIYISVYVFYAPMRKKLHVLIGMLIVAIVMAVFAVPNLLLVHTTEKRSLIVGILCVIFNIGLYASPLTIVKKVFETKSAEFLPFWVCLAGMLNGTCWTIYGLLPIDYNLLIGNGLGALLGLFQLGLIWYFGGEKKEEEQMTKYEVEIANIV